MKTHTELTELNSEANVILYQSGKEKGFHDTLNLPI